MTKNQISLIVEIKIREDFWNSNKMQMINRPFFLFWSVIFLISPVICQGVTCMCFNFNKLKIEKNEKTGRTGQNAGNGVFGNLLGGNGQKGGLSNGHASAIPRLSQGGEIREDFGM